MTTPLLPSPEPGRNDPANDDPRRDDAGDCHEEARTHRSQGAGRRRPVASEEDCLAALSSLPGLVALGLLSTSQANAIRGVYTAMLQHHRQSRMKNERGGVVDDALVDMLARHPELANLLEPILSAEQIAAILARAEEGSHGAA